MPEPNTPSCATTFHETSEVPTSIDSSRPYQALFLGNDDTICSGTALYHLNHRRKKLEIGFTKDQTSRVSDLAGNTNDHGRLRVAGGATWLYGDPLERIADQSHRGGNTVREGDPTLDPAGDGHPVGGEQQEGTVEGDTVKGKE
jgi:hypothetical protein